MDKKDTLLSSAISPLSGWQTIKFSTSTPNAFEYAGSKACSASTSIALPPSFCKIYRRKSACQLQDIYNHVPELSTIVQKLKTQKGKSRQISTCTSAIAWSAMVVFPLLSGPNICRKRLHLLQVAAEFNQENKIINYRDQGSFLLSEYMKSL